MQKEKVSLKERNHFLNLCKERNHFNLCTGRNHFNLCKFKEIISLIYAQERKTFH